MELTEQEMVICTGNMFMDYIMFIYGRVVHQFHTSS